jgi:N-acetylglutamate synthase-like GNAT family acetyltransferase
VQFAVHGADIGAVMPIGKLAPRCLRSRLLAGGKDRMLRSRTLDTDEFTKIEDFYKKNRYDSPISADDHFLVIENEDEIIGALRVCNEEGVFVLRGMHVADALQRQSIGSELLVYFCDFIDNKECYCIAHRYLKSFYGRVGFEEPELCEVPEFLNARLHHYQTKLGLDVLLLSKPAIVNQASR